MKNKPSSHLVGQAEVNFVIMNYAVICQGNEYELALVFRLVVARALVSTFNSPLRNRTPDKMKGITSWEFL